MSDARISERDRQPDLSLMDQHGCLTPEVLCFIDELPTEARSLVQRHLERCTTCAQQQVTAAKAAERIRAGRPRVGVPADARILARQAALRDVVLRRKREVAARRRAERLHQRDPSPTTRHGKRTLWLVLVSAMVLSLGGLIWLILA